MSVWRFRRPRAAGQSGRSSTRRIRDYPGLRFFGLGNNSGSEDRVFFGQKNEILGGGITAESRWVDLRVEANRMTIETGSANRDPSVEAVFPVIQDPSVAPLFGARTAYNVVVGSVTANLVDRYNYPRVGLWMTAEGWRYDDQDSRPVQLYQGRRPCPRPDSAG